MANSLQPREPITKAARGIPRAAFFVPDRRCLPLSDRPFILLLSPFSCRTAVACRCSTGRLSFCCRLFVPDRRACRCPTISESAVYPSAAAFSVPDRRCLLLSGHSRTGCLSVCCRLFRAGPPLPPTRPPDPFLRRTDAPKAPKQKGPGPCESRPLIRRRSSLYEPILPLPGRQWPFRDA